MRARILAFGGGLLIIFSYGFAAPTEDAALSGGHLLWRVVPIGLVLVLSLIATAARDIARLISHLFTGFGAAWLWYASVAAVAGFVSGVQPLWSAWKCLEIMVVVVWSAAIAAHADRYGHVVLIERVVRAISLSAFGLVLWTLFRAIRAEGIFELLIGSTLGDYRLSGTWPTINPISVSLLGVITLIGTLNSGRRGVLFIVGPLGVGAAAVIFARSRTGLLALILFASILLMGRMLGAKQRRLLAGLVLAVLLLLSVSAGARDVLRVSTFDDVMNAGGRLDSAVHDRSAWENALRYVAASPAVGIGYVNLSRFVTGEVLPVDNGALQALIAAGFVGALPPIVGVLVLSVRWVRISRSGAFVTSSGRRLRLLGIACMSAAVAKGVTTNELSVYGPALVLLLVSSSIAREVRGSTAGSRRGGGPA